VLLGAQGEGVAIEATGGVARVLFVTTSVVAVGLDTAEVATLARTEAVGAVELKLGLLHELVVSALIEIHVAGQGVGVEGARPVVEGILISHVLDAPHELLHGVVEVQVDVGVLVGGSNRGGAVHLELLDQILVALAGEAAALISVKVDVVDIQKHLVEVDPGKVADTA